MFRCPLHLTPLFLALALTCAIPSVSGQALQFALTVENPTDIDLVGEPVASGLSVPRWANFTQPHFLSLHDRHGQSVPFQYKVLSRWDAPRDDTSAAIKWLLVEFPAEVTASGRSTYSLVAGIAQAGSITTQTTASSITVDTGAATFLIDRANYTIIDQVHAADGTLLTSNPGRLDIVDLNGLIVNSILQSCTIEEAGSVRTVVKQTGFLPSLGLHFTNRLFFWTDRSTVKVEFRLENRGDYGEVGGTGTPDTAHFESLYMSFHTKSTVNQVVTPNTVHALGTNEPYVLEQRFTQPGFYDLHAGFVFEETVSGTQVATGNRHEGAVAAVSSESRVIVSVDRFWQNFPKSIEARDTTVSVGLWPSFGSGPYFNGTFSGPGLTPATDPNAVDHYRFEGGRWKTHTFDIDFLPSDADITPSRVANAAERTNHPLMARASDRGWSFRNNAFGMPIVDKKNWTDVSSNRFEKLVSVLAHDDTADDQPIVGRVGLPLFRARGGTYGGLQFYGWENFGDVAWGDGYSSNHYDLNWGVLINYTRTGDYAFFDMARDMCAHRRDYDQNHSVSGTGRSGGQYYEKGWFHGNTYAPTPSHGWVHGMLLYYALTGDEGSLEAAEEYFGFLSRLAIDNWNGWYGTRILGWGLDAVCDLYNYVGKPEYKDFAESTMQRWLSLEAQWGTQGWIPNPAFQNNSSTSWMHGIVMGALAKYHNMTHDPAPVAAMGRMADWLLADCFHTYPTGPSQSRSVACTWANVGANVQGNPNVHHTWTAIDALANASLCTGNENYFLAAKDLWESQTRYFQHSAGDSTPRNYNDPSNFHAIGFRMFQFPSSESKVMSQIARWGHSYLAVSDIASLIF